MSLKLRFFLVRRIRETSFCLQSELRTMYTVIIQIGFQKDFEELKSMQKENNTL